MTPPFTITPAILAQVAAIGEQVGRLEVQIPPERQVLLRRGNRLRTIHGSLAIEGNTLSLDQVTAVVAGMRVLGTTREVQEVRGAVAAYERLGTWDPTKRQDLLDAHAVLMAGLVDRPGTFRTTAAGVQRGTEVVHVAPPAQRVPGLINGLLAWLRTTPDHPLIAACVWHYEFEFIHPFVDGNGRLGRLWQTLILSHWKPVLALVPVESLIRDHQAGYYAALNAANQAGASTPFIAFMLQVIHDALATTVGTPQDSPQVSPQVARLMTVLRGDMDRATLQAALGLSDRKSFALRYLKPALAAGLIAHTLPDAPNSRWQGYRLTDAGRRLRASLNSLEPRQ
jgi:Fic family protein